MSAPTPISTRKRLQSINPATGAVLQEVDQDAPDRLEAKLALAQETFQRWRRTSFSERAELLTRAAAVLEADEGALARLMTLEMGKPIAAARQEIRKCALCCRYYAEQAETLLRDEPVASNDARCWVKYQPLGAVLAVMPWNFPFWQVFRFAAPSLMAGNVGLLKHASNVPQCALAIESVFVRAGLPAGAFQTLLIDSEAVGRVIADARVRAVTLTGSLGAGSAVAALAGRHIKKTVLELGGSDPFIVMPSTDLQRAAAAAVQARTINNGQSCIAAKRFLVHREVIAEFQRLFVERMAGLKVGDPLDPLTEIGPLATTAVRDDIERQVRASVELGAKLLLGGERLPGPGYFFPPTILANIPPQSPAAREELFGPVAGLFEVKDLQHALELANDSDFGLGASLWTNDPREQELFIEEIEAGAAFVNGIVVSDNRLPFGGIKQSGYGRELSYQGLREFVNVKTVWVRGVAET